MPPFRLDAVASRDILAATARPFAQLFTVPGDADLGCDDQPVHSSKTVAEKRRGGTDDVVIGFIPRGKALALARLTGQAAKPHESMHFMQIAVHLLGQTVQRDNVAVGGIGMQAGLVAQSPENAVGEIEARGIAVQQGGLQHCEHWPVEPQRRGIWRAAVCNGRQNAWRLCAAEQIATNRVPRNTPDDVAGLGLFGQELARDAAPFGEII